MKFKRLLALETIYLQNTIPPACLIHQRPRINTIATRDQFQRIQISAELKQWLLTTIRHYSYYSLFAIRVFQTPSYLIKIICFILLQSDAQYVLDEESEITNSSIGEYIGILQFSWDLIYLLFYVWP